MKPRPRKTDSLEVQKLFELHKKLNHGGAHWIKGYMSRFIKGKGSCWCLAGGVFSVTRSRLMRERLLEILHDALPKTMQRTFPGASAFGCITSFNDADYTQWYNVEKVIFQAIENGRKAQ